MSTVLDFQCSRANPSKVGGPGQSAKYFPRPLGSSLTSGQPITPSAVSAAGSLWLPTGPAYDGVQFNVVAAGTFGFDSGDPSGTVRVELDAVTGSLLTPIYTAIASTPSLTPTFNTPLPWALNATLIGDSVSGLLGGYYTAVGLVAGTIGRLMKLAAPAAW